jgi:pimeloyl-ACP methyl ester carboxylesterase
VLDSTGKITGQLLAGSPASGRATVLPILHVLGGPMPAAVVLGLDEVASVPVAPNVMRVGRSLSQVEWVLWKAQLPSGAGRVMERGSPQTTGWDVDRNGQGRVRFDDDESRGRHLILTRAKGETAWSVFAKAKDKESLPTYLGYSDPEDAIYLARKGPGGVTQVVARKLADGSTRVVATSPGPDPVLLLDGFSRAPVAIAYETDRPGYIWLDPKLEALSERLAKSFPDRAIRFADWSFDRSRILVETTGPDAPPAWFLVDEARGEVSPVAQGYPELKDAALGRSSWISYHARDGMEIHAYLTLPPGQPSGSRPPLVVLPHGGPATRDDFAFDWWVQFLASRGYAVLQPQFRGSAGFGKAFELAGQREWGGKIQTDLLDGVADLGARGVIDPGRACIVGGSFGGYEALAAAALHPDAFRCAVSVNGVSDLELFLHETIRSYGPDSELLAYWRQQLGARRDASKALQAISPVRLVAAIRAPVLLVAGSDDTTVPYEQSTAMERALKAAGRPVQLVTLDDEDHYLSTPEGRTRMLEAVEAFLAQNLPAGG